MLQLKNEPKGREPEEAARVARLVAHLRTLDTYDLARWCELRLAQELPGIEVRPSRQEAA